MGHSLDNRRADIGHLPAMVAEIVDAQVAYEQAEQEFQKELQLLLDRASCVAFLTRASAEKDGRA